MASLIEFATLALKLGRFEEAIKAAGEILEKHPDDFNAARICGLANARLGHNDVALHFMGRAADLKPGHAPTFSEMAIILMRLGRLQDALVCGKQSVLLNPNLSAVYSNNGLILYNMGRYADALLSYQKCLEVNPDDPNGLCNSAITQLLLGDYAGGWSKYEARWRTPTFINGKPPWPIWLGETSIKGKTIFVNSEQGFGDVIQFSRYLPLLVEAGAKVIFGTRPQLQLLMQETFPDCTVIATGDELLEFDLFTSLMSLPQAFGTTLDSIPPPTDIRFPCRRPDLQLMGRRPAIGLVWSGNAADPASGDGLNRYRDGLRSLAFSDLEPLLDLPATWFSLQKDVRDHDANFAEVSPVYDIRHGLDDFAATAEIINVLDLVITADTAIAHLAASMGKPTWIMLPYVPCWRWMLDRSDSPWYPTVRLFRQPKQHDWASVIDAVRSALAEEYFDARRRHENVRA